MDAEPGGLQKKQITKGRLFLPLYWGVIMGAP